MRGILQVCRASAGSGKTYTLVQQYLRLCLRSNRADSFKHILAITFTNKAASELKERVFRELKSLSEGNTKSQMAVHLRSELSLSTEELQIRAQNTLRAMLHQYGDVAIGTIDQFMHRLVRSFSRDLALQHDFSVDTDNDPVVETAVEKVFRRVGSDEVFTQIMLDFVEYLLDENKSWNVGNQLLATAKSAILTKDSDFTDELDKLTLEQFTEARTALHKACKKYEATVKTFAKQGLDLINTHKLTDADFHYASKGLGNYFRRVFHKGYTLLPNSYVNTALERVDFSGKGPNSALVKELSPQFEEILLNIVAHIEKDSGKYVVALEMIKRYFRLMLMRELSEAVHMEKEDLNLLFVDDFHQLISDVVTEEPAPFIYERIGQRIRHLMIDEFQDTSVTQWRNFLPLVTDVLSTGGFAMLVGDGKQAIYRWRGGEVEQFSRLPELYPPDNTTLTATREQVLRAHHQATTLDSNFRSDKVIVEFNNKLYPELKEYLHEEHQNIFEGCEQKVVKNEGTGLVTLHFVEGSKNEEKHPEYLKLTLQFVKEAEEDGYQPRDIAVLLRDRKTQGIVAQHLRKEGYEVVSESSLLVENDVVVSTIVGAMRHLADPLNPQHAMALLLMLADEYLEPENRHATMQRFIRRDNENPKILMADVNGFMGHIQLPGLSSLLLRQSLFDMCQTILRNLKMEPKCGPQWSFFAQHVLDFAASKGNDLPAFLAWWDKVRDQKSISLPEDVNAIRITSIHKSKGLQYKVVIMPFADWAFSINNAEYWANTPPELKLFTGSDLPPVMLTGFTKSLEGSVLQEQMDAERSRQRLDNLNLLYVGTTRAEERLHIISHRKEPKGAPKNIAEWLMAALPQLGYSEEGEVIGARKRPKIRELPSESSNVVPVCASSDWRDRLKISFESGELSEGQFSGNARQMGSLCHRVLAEMQSVQDLNEVLAHFETSGIANAEVVALLRKQVEQLLELPEARKWFRHPDHTLSEHPVLLPDGSTLRPDRVILKDNHATIVDFKTGSFRAEHEKQLTQYGAVLNQMGYHCTLHLAYLDPAEIRTVEMPRH
ncbi:MAG: hypothetical protein EA392_11280 [Cryomorphaceae bacterium]|nr:MAG: hypothetical protein EA392_11280 [Cryomorphaceae bacterium]